MNNDIKMGGFTVDVMRLIIILFIGFILSLFLTGCESATQKDSTRIATDLVNEFPYSRDYLIDKLLEKNFTRADAIYGTDKSVKNWKLQPTKAASQLLSTHYFSQTRLMNRLISLKFTNAEAKYGVDNSGADWNAQALGTANALIENDFFISSRPDVKDRLEELLFTNEQINYVFNKLDWNKVALKRARKGIDTYGMWIPTKDDIHNMLLQEVFTQNEANYAVNQITIVRRKSTSIYASDSYEIR